MNEERISQLIEQILSSDNSLKEFIKVSKSLTEEECLILEDSIARIADRPMKAPERNVTEIDIKIDPVSLYRNYQCQDSRGCIVKPFKKIFKLYPNPSLPRLEMIAANHTLDELVEHALEYYEAE